MRYTQGQVRDLVDLSVDAFRTWRDHLPALAAHKGHGPTFTSGDVVVLAIITELVRDYGVRVGLLTDRLNQLFEACHGKSWVALEHCVVLVSPDAVRLVDESSPRIAGDGTTRLLIPCSPIIERLRAKLVSSEIDQPQGYLQFSLTAVGAR